MHTKPAEAMFNVPGGMHLVSGQAARLIYNSRSGKSITAQNMSRHQSSSACT
jgi:hypothetical protein